MTKLDEYRRRAEECRHQAEQCTSHADKTAWLELSADWLALANTSPHSATERFEAMERSRGTHQTKSDAQH